MSAVVFRRYQPGDLEQCARLAADAWPVKEHVSQGSESWRVFEPYVGIGLACSNWTCVVCDEAGKVIGVIFGDIRGLEGSSSIRRIVKSELSAYSGMILGRWGKVKDLIPLLWNFTMTELKLAVGRPNADAEIMLLVLDREYRGRGIGRDLVDRFAKAAKDAGAGRISVYTDDQASNWRFYERYGFRRYSVFYDNWSSYFEGRPSKGIRFEIDL